MYDTAVKIPALASMPGSVPQDLVCDRLLSQYDVMPTLLGYTGVDNPHADSLPGRDFSPVLRGESLGDSTPGVRVRRVWAHAHDSRAQLEVCASLPRWPQ